MAHFQRQGGIQREIINYKHFSLSELQSQHILYYYPWFVYYTPISTFLNLFTSIAQLAPKHQSHVCVQTRYCLLLFMCYVCDGGSLFYVFVFWFYMHDGYQCDSRCYLWFLGICCFNMINSSLKFHVQCYLYIVLDSYEYVAHFHRQDGIQWGNY